MKVYEKRIFVRQEKIITEEDWRTLYDTAIAFKNLKCWQWMYDSDLFGVQNPDDNKTGYCCIMGKLGEFKALAVYLGTEGLESYKRIYSGKRPDEKPETTNSQKCLMVSFEDRDDLDEEDIEILDILDLEFTGNSQWPIFRSYEPGYLPWFLTAKEIKFLTTAIEQSIIVSKKAKKNKSTIKSEKKNTYLIRVFENGKWSEKWLTPPKIQRYQIMPVFDFTLLKNLKTKKIAKSGNWELSFIHLQTAVREETEKPYYPYLILIVDTDIEQTIGFELCEPGKINMRLPTMLLKTIQKNKMMPKKITVNQNETIKLISNITDELSIKIEKMKTLNLLNSMLSDVISLINMNEYF